MEKFHDTLLQHFKSPYYPDCHIHIQAQQLGGKLAKQISELSNKVTRIEKLYRSLAETEKGLREVYRSSEKRQVKHNEIKTIDIRHV